ncbi:hypothetical protein, partial [Streptomyces sp. NPDC001274]
ALDRGRKFEALGLAAGQFGGRGGAVTEDDAVYMGETDPFARRQVAYTAPPAAGRHPGEYRGLPGGVALSYLTPGAGWQTIWRTLANGGELAQGV